ncbi:uncharacterized protein RAG0_12157 [Rhynchosporium agropyri]|uniref:Uncharacterized protein n=1 Tax=Rhynchosporium agropyri TaxID=914238 RepID=A0A1E1L7I2_9HELO|nr:uncharacterized protein RAG0_12157 [Rhynchosporium agropyri]
MPTLEDVEMGNSSSSEVREVEMEGAGLASEQGAVESLLPGVASNGHVASDEVNGKSGHGMSKASNDYQETKRTSSNGHVDVDPSAKQDGSQPPGTAHEEMTSPAAGVGRSAENNAEPSKGEKNAGPIHEPPPAVQSIKMEKEIARLHEVLAEVSPQAAQKVLKEKWRMFLFEDYNEAHIAFILRAGLKNSNQEILDRVLKDEGGFKDNLLKTVIKKPEFVEKVLKKTPPEIIAASISESALDHMMAERFKTVPGKTLIKWLATAGRLGYKADDILDEEDESVSPALPSRETSVEIIGAMPITRAQGQYHPQYQPPPHLQVHSHPRPYPLPPTQPYRPPPQSYPQPPPPRPQFLPHLANLYKDPLLMEQERQALLNNQQAQDVQVARARYAQASQKQLRNSNQGPPHPGPPNPVPSAAAVRAPHEQTVRSPTDVPTGPLMCTLCQRSFPPGSFDGYTYHITKKVCEKEPPASGYKWSCPNCLSGFTTKQGLDYHNARKVCNDDDIAPATPLVPPNEKTSSTSTPTLPHPPMHMSGPPSQLQAPSQLPSSQALTRPPGAVAQPAVQSSRPDMFTPRRGPGRPKKENIRHSPSELTPEKRAAMEKAIADAEADTAEKIAALASSEYSEEARQRRTTSLTNAIATRKSQIRKSFGVSLRMRETDKQARLAAGIGSLSGPSRIREFDAPSSVSPGVSPPASSFSPINGNSNTSRPSASLPSDGYTGPSSQGPYRIPAYDSAIRSNGHESPLRAVQTSDGASPSGYGVLKASGPSPYPGYYPPTVNNKRKYGSQEPHLRADGATPQMSMMMEVSTEDAASKFEKGYKKKMADREERDREHHERARDVNMTDAPASAPKEKISIEISSSDSEEVESDVVKSVEDDHGVEENVEPRKISVGPGMARREGKH